MKCGHCDGKGRVYVTDPALDGAYMRAVCPRCKGAGEIPDHPTCVAACGWVCDCRKCRAER